MTPEIETRRRPRPPAPEEYEADLRRVRSLTRRMRESERRIADAGLERRLLLRDLRARHVPFRILAAATGLTEQAIYKDLRWGRIPEQPEQAAPPGA